MTAGTKGATKLHKMENHEKAPLLPLGSTTPLNLEVEIYEETRTGAANKT